MGYADRKSYSINDIFMNGDLVALCTHMQPVVAVPFDKAEYSVVSDAS